MYIILCFGVYFPKMDGVCINDLSDDVLIVVFKILQISPFALRRVCKRWWSLAEYLYRNLDVYCTNISHSHNDCHTIERYIRMFPRVSFRITPIHQAPDESDHENNFCTIRLKDLVAYRDHIKCFYFSERVSDIYKLHRFTDVEELHLSHFIGLRSLRHIKKLHKLRKLTVLDMTISSVKHLRRLVNLQDVYISCLVKDISPLRYLKLTRLDLWWMTKIDDVSCKILSQITTLRSLNLSYTNISDISSLTNLNLTDLVISYTHVTDISAVKMFRNLVSLNISGLDVADISSIAYLTKLQYLWMRGTDVSSITPLENLVDLRTLDISHNPYIRDISPLRNMSSLTFLDITNTFSVPEVLDGLPHMSIEKIYCNDSS